MVYNFNDYKKIIVESSIMFLDSEYSKDLFDELSEYNNSESNVVVYPSFDAEYKSVKDDVLNSRYSSYRKYNAERLDKLNVGKIDIPAEVCNCESLIEYLANKGEDVAVLTWNQMLIEWIRENEIRISIINPLEDNKTVASYPLLAQNNYSDKNEIIRLIEEELFNGNLNCLTYKKYRQLSLDDVYVLCERIIGQVGCLNMQGILLGDSYKEKIAFLNSEQVLYGQIVFFDSDAYERLSNIEKKCDAIDNEYRNLYDLMFNLLTLGMSPFYNGKYRDWENETEQRKARFGLLTVEIKEFFDKVFGKTASKNRMTPATLLYHISREKESNKKDNKKKIYSEYFDKFLDKEKILSEHFMYYTIAILVGLLIGVGVCMFMGLI